MLILIHYRNSLTIVLLTALFFTSCTARNEPTGDSKLTDYPVTTTSGLIYEVLEKGSGPFAEPGDMVLIHETTQLADSTIITDTWEMNSPIRFLLGGNQVIEGLDEAVTGMRVGERRKLVVPPSLSKRSSYPTDGRYSPDDTLYYNVILLQTSQQ